MSPFSTEYIKSAREGPTIRVNSGHEGFRSKAIQRIQKCRHTGTHSPDVPQTLDDAGCSGAPAIRAV